MIGDGLTMDCHIFESWKIGQGFAMDWQRIGEKLAELADIGSATDRHWIGNRLAPD